MKLPRDNGRPQLWIGMRLKNYRYDDRLRVIWPSGHATWTFAHSFNGHRLDWGIYAPCWQPFDNYTSRRPLSINAQIKRMIAYDRKYGRETYFLGYL